MRIKHINAGPNEYVAVHRHGGSSRRTGGGYRGSGGGSGGGGGGGGGSGSEIGCFIIIAIFVVIFFWRIILMTALFCALGYGIIYCIGKFHREIWHGIVVSFSGIGKLLKKGWSAARRTKIGSKKGKSSTQTNFSSLCETEDVYCPQSSNYGKIIQKK